MDGSEYLYTLAEVSVAFVGFASIVVAIRQLSGDLIDLDRLLIVWLIERSFAALAFALLPPLLHHFGAPSQRILPISSGLLAAYLLVTIVRVTLLSRRHGSAFSLSGTGLAFRGIVLFTMFPIQTAAALGLLPFAALGWYLLGVSWLLLAAGTLFSTILTSRAA